MSLIRLWVTLQFLGTCVLLLTLSGRVKGRDDGGEGVRFSSLTKAVDKTRGNTPQHFYEDKLVALAYPENPKGIDGLSEENVSAQEGDGVRYQKDDLWNRFPSRRQPNTGNPQEQFLAHGYNKRGWEGINFDGKRTAEKPFTLTDKRGWERIRFNSKKTEDTLSRASKRGWEGMYEGKKRSPLSENGQIMEEFKGYRATKKDLERKLFGKHGLEGRLSGKRGWEGLYGKRGWEGMYGKRGWEGMYGKRGWEGLYGKRGWEGLYGKRGWEGMYGKRGWEGLYGKRGWEGLYGKRGWEGIIGKPSKGLFDKRSLEGLIPGKRGWEGLYHNCSCCQGEQFRSCCSSCDQTNPSPWAGNPPAHVEFIRDIVCACCERVQIPSCCDVCQVMRRERS